MRQFRTSGSVRGVAREGDSYRDMFNCPPPRDAGEDEGGGLNGLNDWNVWNVSEATILLCAYGERRDARQPTDDRAQPG